ncbi:MOSC domain-containing protein, partial [Mesorhizobium sp. M7A.F.Ca.CA.002.05.1.1]
MQAALGTVSELWRYPASSLAGERRETISVDIESI